MADVVHRITELRHIRLSLFGCSDDDACNRLNHRHTVLMLLIFSAILTSRLFISDLVICWTPGEFTGNYNPYRISNLSTGRSIPLIKEKQKKTASTVVICLMSRGINKSIHLNTKESQMIDLTH